MSAYRVTFATLERIKNSYKEWPSGSFPTGYLKQAQVTIGIGHAELVAVLRESHAGNFGKSAWCSRSSHRRLMSPFP